MRPIYESICVCYTYGKIHSFLTIILSRFLDTKALIEKYILRTLRFEPGLCLGELPLLHKRPVSNFGGGVLLMIIYTYKTGATSSNNKC